MPRLVLLTYTRLPEFHSSLSGRKKTFIATRPYTRSRLVVLLYEQCMKTGYTEAGLETVLMKRCKKKIVG